MMMHACRRKRRRRRGRRRRRRDLAIDKERDGIVDGHVSARTQGAASGVVGHVARQDTDAPV
jgi:hypothetical protein